MRGNYSFPSTRISNFEFRNFNLLILTMVQPRATPIFGPGDKLESDRSPPPDYAMIINY